jgi:hypothetical protein
MEGVYFFKEISEQMDYLLHSNRMSLFNVRVYISYDIEGGSGGYIYLGI